MPKIRKSDAFLVLALSVTLQGCLGTPEVADAERVSRIHEGAIVFDAHAHPKPGGGDPSVPGQSSGRIEVDFPTMEEGGVDALFFSVPFLGGTDEGIPPVQSLLDDIAILKEEVTRNAHLAELATSPEDISRIQRSGRIAVLIGVETEDPFHGELGAIRELSEAGVRMVVMTPLLLSGKEGGEGTPSPLSEFGGQIIREMNRQGIIIDISHLPDDLQSETIRSSLSPVVASHSCARALNDVPRQMPDSLIRALAENGGVIAVTFYPGHISPDFPDEEVTVEDLVDHIDHIVRIAGIDHVGFGSDFPGGSTQTLGLESAAGLPNLSKALFERGYSKEEIEKVMGGNLLRVFERVG